MKKRLIFLLLNTLLVLAGQAETNHPVGPVLDKEKVLGTWHTVEKGLFYTTDYYFTIYADQRIFMVTPAFPQPCNGSWIIEDDLFIPTYDNYYSMGTFRTISIDEKTWTFVDLNTNITRVAYKTSAVPAPVPQEFNVQQPQSSVIAVGQLFGTWKAETNKGERFYFTLYEDRRFWNCYGMNGNWTVLGDKFYNYPDGRNAPYITKTISFSSQKWVYEGLGTGTRYTATRVSWKPMPGLTGKCKQAPPPPRTVCPICKKPTDQCPGHEHPHCTCCAGNGTQQCTRCYGNGTRTERGSDGREYRVNCGYCSNGRVTCGCCNGSGNQ